MSRRPEASFVNPYTFVPLPEVDGVKGFRRRPAGHGKLGAGRFSGRVEVELTARAPVLIRGVRAGEEGSFPRRVFPDLGSEAVPFIPGSSLAGTVRSLYETLAGGCLRVFDGEFVPGYRNEAKQQGKGWSLAVVGPPGEDGKPVSMRVCSQVVWVDSAVLEQVLRGPKQVVTGARVKVTGYERQDFFGRNQTDDPAHVTSGNNWVVMVTDAGAREGNPKCHTYWCAVGRLPDASDRGVPVSDGAWAAFQAAVAGAEDVRVARRDGDLATTEAQPAPVSWNGKVVGVRHLARPDLHEGQVVWARTGGSPRQITEISLAALWRHAGAFPAGERVPRALLPCTDPTELCPACRVFGSADTSGADTPEARQASYRGHVRFSDARPLDETTETTKVRLAPLGAPRPGAGQFYLTNDPGRDPGRAQDQPLREWGSPADRDGERPRRLRGRKQYWLTDNHVERPFFRARKGRWEGEMAQDAEQVDAGANFTFSVFVDGLDLAELGGLLAALDPGLLFDGEVGYAVGGGKPLGFGTCTAQITALDLTDAAARYLGAEPPAVSAEDAVAAFRAQVPPEVGATWKAAQAALTLDRVAPGTVWYPPQRPLREGELSVDDLEAGFAFWKESRGVAHDNSVRPLIPLPWATAADQSLPVIRKEERD